MIPKTAPNRQNNDGCISSELSWPKILFMEIATGTSQEGRVVLPDVMCHATKAEHKNIDLFCSSF